MVDVFCSLSILGRIRDLQPEPIMKPSRSFRMALGNSFGTPKFPEDFSKIETHYNQSAGGGLPESNPEGIMTFRASENHPNFQ